MCYLSYLLCMPLECLVKRTLIALLILMGDGVSLKALDCRNDSLNKPMNSMQSMEQDSKESCLSMKLTSSIASTGLHM